MTIINRWNMNMEINTISIGRFMRISTGTQKKMMNTTLSLLLLGLGSQLKK